MKFIPGYEELYSATEDGRIYSHYYKRYLKPEIDMNGYYRVVLNKDKKPKHYSVHRLIALTFIENPENKYAIDHINRIKTDNNVSNLRYVTREENCANTIVYKNNKLGQKHIVIGKYSYRFSITRNGIYHSKYFKTLEEAIEYRDAYLN